MRQAAVLVLALAAPVAAQAQTAYLEQSGITGFGTARQIARLPTMDSSGKIKYWDVVIDLSVAAGGKPSVASTTATMSAPLVTDHFVPGRYSVQYGTAATQYGTLTEGVGSGGSTVWSLTMDTSPDGDFPAQATWQTGAPSPDVATRLANAKVGIDPNASYGLTVVGNHLNVGYGFNADNGLLAAEQISGNLTLKSYTDGNGYDKMLPTGDITLTLCAVGTCPATQQ